MSWMSVREASKHSKAVIGVALSWRQLAKLANAQTIKAYKPFELPTTPWLIDKDSLDEYLATRARGRRDPKPPAP